MPATATRASTADFIVSPLRRAIAYADALNKDIPAEKFAFMPVKNMNHPAFIMGHLSIYPNRILKMVGLPELVVEKPGYEDLFKAGVQCVDKDPRYPAKAEIMAYWQERYTSIANVLPTVPDEVFQRENPIEGRMRELFPLVGMAANFMLNSHVMMHLGQVSAWRRAIGLGSAM